MAGVPKLVLKADCIFVDQILWLARPKEWLVVAENPSQPKNQSSTRGGAYASALEQRAAPRTMAPCA